MDATISLGGKDWIIPPLAVKQNRIIDPIIISLIPLFTDWKTDRIEALSKIQSEQYDALLTMAYTAITRGNPALKREDFDELSITLPELIAAFTPIAQQTGVFARGAPGEATAV